MKTKIIFMPHANIQYSQLKPEKREWVIKNCYEKLFDLIDNGDYKIAFEASGITIDEIAEKAPEVMAKLKRLIAEGKIEPVASPYIHFMLANIPYEVCVDSLIHSRDVWEKHTGVRPKVGWNPECGWAGYIPDAYKEAGFESLVMDADSFLLSFDEIRKATGLEYDVAGHSNKNHLFKIEEYIKDKPEFLKYITNPSVAPNGLKMIFRSDCMANLLLWYLMGATEGLRSEPISMDEINKIIAESDNIIENNYIDCIENGVAWHGGTAKAWANTDYSRIMDPVCMSILNGIKAVAEKLGENMKNLDVELKNAMKALASAWVSDSRWPPEPTSPGRFNVRESLDDMYKANEAIAKAMENGKIADKRGIYSPNLMHTQIKAIDDKLMNLKYFGE